MVIKDLFKTLAWVLHHTMIDLVITYYHIMIVVERSSVQVKWYWTSDYEDSEHYMKSGLRQYSARN
jgi:hypothetical protein